MPISVTNTRLPGVLIIEPIVFEDERGFFFESFNKDDFRDYVDSESVFVQDNHSKSAKGVLRGLHYQVKQPQGKLVRVLDGAVFDVAVDIRKESPNFGMGVGIELSSENKKQLWIPPNFAHGFLVISETAQVLYKTTDSYAPQFERSIRWDDPDLGIEWPELDRPIELSLKDRNAPTLANAELPGYLK